MTDPIEQAVRAVRFLAVDAVEAANSGHPGTPMGLAQIGVELYTSYLRYDPKHPAWPNRDRFVLSCGHASMLIYSLLHLAGYDLSLDDLKAFRQWGSKTPGHPEVGVTPGVETTTGPLGQGIGNAVGMALAGKMMAARVNTKDATLIDYDVYTIVSDGDLMEGVSREAISVAGHLGLSNLIAIWDDNRITIDGTTDITFSEDLRLVFQGAGWRVESADGHDRASIRAALDAAKAETERPTLIIARTHIGYGCPNKQDKSAAHGAPLGKAEIEATKQAAGWPLSPTFYVPDAAYEPFRSRAEENKKRYDQWVALLDRLGPEEKSIWNAFVAPEVPADLLQQLIAAAGEKADSTRKLASVVEQKLAALMPRLIGGSADLNGSVLTYIAGAKDVKRGDFAGRNINFGIREHGMGSILNGLSLSGFFVPFGSTFLMFSDYCRPAIRLAGLMEKQVVFVFSHDTVYLGEDGPTHQPVEQIASLRLIPNVRVVRPADAVECGAAWAMAATRTHGPTVLVLSRQGLPKLARPAGFEPNQVLKGAYVLVDVPNPELVLISSGSEVGVSVAAAERLAAKGRRVRVVSAPCWQEFERLPAAEQQQILPPGVRRAAFEIGSTVGWRGVVGLDGLVIGRDEFGVSAPWERIQKEFGFDAEQVAARIDAHFFG
ncbi:MAG: transketolase [Polyangiaceae bacterium]